MKRKTILLTSWVNPLSLILVLKEIRFVFIIKKYRYNYVFFISNIVSEDKTRFVISGISKQRRVRRYPRGNQQYICKVQHVLFALFLFVYVQWRPTLIVLCFCFVCLRLVYPMLLLTRKLLNQSHHFERFTVVTMTWLSAMEYLCQKWPRICSTCRKHCPVLCSFMTYYRVCN
jgi:hypothetical protein